MKSVYNYNDPIDYINDYIDYKKCLDESFSIRQWSHTLELKSPVVLLDILKRRKKLRGKTLEQLMDKLPIDNSEKMYFQAISERSLSDNLQKTKMYDLIIKELKPYDVDNYSCYRNEKDIDIFSHWIYMAILSMTNLGKFKLTVDNIKNKLYEDIDREVIENAMFKLFEHGFLKLRENGSVICQYTSHSTKSDSIDENVSKYYNIICDLAKKAINISVDRREFQCFSVAIPEESIPLAKEIIRKARAQIVSLGSEDKTKNNAIYQGNLMLFPLTK